MRFDYLEPKTIEEAVSLLSKYDGRAKVIAGGTDLMVEIRNKAIKPGYVVDIAGISGLDYIKYNNKQGLRIGALTTIRALETSTEVQHRYPVISQAASQLGSVAIRNVGTIGGNLCNAAPSAEMAPPLIALGARVKIRAANGERIIPIEDFFTGPGQTVLKPNELVTEIQVPDLPPRSGGVYIKHSIRKAQDLAIVGVGAITTMDKDVLSDVKIALGAVAPTPIRAKKAEEILKGKKPESDLLEKAGLAASQEASPIDDVRGSAEYRRKMIRVLVKRAIKQAVEQVKTG